MKTCLESVTTDHSTECTPAWIEAVDNLEDVRLFIWTFIVNRILYSIGESVNSEADSETIEIEALHSLEVNALQFYCNFKAVTV